MIITASGTIDIAKPVASLPTIPSVKEAFLFCERLARAHYENFPVASFFIPRDRRPYMWSIYAFARTADDIADEGDATSEQRLALLDRLEEDLDECYHGRATRPIFIALAETIQACRIPRQPLVDLLTAFRMDVTQKRFRAFSDLLNYCKHSANPIGQLVLHVFENANDRTVALSDNVCTALQLANFWQDISIDWQNGRLYIPLEDGKRFGYTEHDIDRHVVDERFRTLMAFEVDRTRQLFEAGKPLLHEVTPELRLELNLTWRGGIKILDKIERLEYDVLRQRPVVSTWDKISILSTSLLRLA